MARLDLAHGELGGANGQKRGSSSRIFVLRQNSMAEQYTAAQVKAVQQATFCRFRRFGERNSRIRLQLRAKHTQPLSVLPLLIGGLRRHFHFPACANPYPTKQLTMNRTLDEMACSQLVFLTEMDRVSGLPICLVQQQCRHKQRSRSIDATGAEPTCYEPAIPLSAFPRHFANKFTLPLCAVFPVLQVLLELVLFPCDAARYACPRRTTRPPRLEARARLSLRV